MVDTRGASPAAQAILSHVQNGSYPDSEATAASIIRLEDLSSIAKGLTSLRLEEEVCLVSIWGLKRKVNARDQAEIRKAGQAAGPAVDPWIKRAGALRDSVDGGAYSSQSVLKQTQAAAQSALEHSSAVSKAQLLRREMTFNELLRTQLGAINDVLSRFQTFQSTMATGNIEQSIHQLQDLEVVLEDVADLKQTRAIELVRQRLEDSRGTLLKQANALWALVISVDKSRHSFVVRSDVTSPQSQTKMTLDEVVRICASLNLVEINSLLLARELQNGIFVPLLSNKTPSGGSKTKVEIDKEGLRISPVDQSNNSQNTGVLASIMAVLAFIKKRLPDAVGRPLSSALVPGLMERLQSKDLPEAIRPSLNEIGSFEALVADASAASTTLESYGWSTDNKLGAWASQAPRLWISRRREASITSVRTLLAAKLEARETVEHVESEEVPLDDEEAMENAMGDDWNADWGADAADTGDKPVSKNATNKTNHAGQSSEDQDEDDNWGWGDGEGDADGAAADAPASNGNGIAAVRAEHATRSPVARGTKQVTLRESFQVTALPSALVEVLDQLASDAKGLGSRSTSALDLASVAGAIYSIPTLVIATYKALAPAYYDRQAESTMLLYNDASRLAERLGDLNKDLQEKDPVAHGRVKLDADIESLKSFARRSYGRAMDAERTIVRDLIDNAQGFVDCTVQPHESTCTEAVASTVAYVKALEARWSPLLSRSVLRQSLGSVVDAVINKVILDIEEMTDIGDEESKQLRQYCKDITKLETLFTDTPEAAESESRNLSSLYVSSWLKFEYMIELLESSLADIKYMWTDTGLGLEYGIEELVDLIKALFADNEHRRRAINELRKA